MLTPLAGRRVLPLMRLSPSLKPKAECLIVLTLSFRDCILLSFGAGVAFAERFGQKKGKEAAGEARKDTDPPKSVRSPAKECRAFEKAAKLIAL